MVLNVEDSNTAEITHSVCRKLVRPKSAGCVSHPIVQTNIEISDEISAVADSTKESSIEHHEKGKCRHGARPKSASGTRLRELYRDWETEQSKWEVLRQGKNDLVQRKNKILDLLTERKTPKKKNVMLSSGMQFLVQEPVQPYRPVIGRSSRRTAFCTDYGGVRITGPERKCENETLRPRSGTPPSPKVGAPFNSFKSSKSSKKSRKKIHVSKSGRLLPHRLPAAGVPSVRPLTAFAGFSVRRIRWYTDYCGRKILIDLNDMPSVSNDWY